MTNFFNFFFQISTNTTHYPAVGINYFRLLILLVFLSLPFGLQASELLSESFNAYEMGDDSINWYDSARNNGMGHDEAMFKVFALGGQKVFGTEQTETTNVHSHYVGSGSTNWTNYEYTGLMRISDAKDGIGVTFFSDYPNSDTYYRLRRYDNQSFHIAPHGAGIQCSGKTDTGVVPAPNTWYHFEIQVEDKGPQTDVRAKVWPAGESEPTDWQASCSDTGGGRRVFGTVGLWAVVSGSDEGAKYWDDLKVRSLSGTPGGTDNNDDAGADGSSGGGTGGGSGDTGGNSGGDGTEGVNEPDKVEEEEKEEEVVVVADDEDEEAEEQIVLEEHPKDSSKVLAFPGAVGFGKYATGGRGGKVIAVTNTSDSESTPGSLPHALKQSGPKIIIFKVGGIMRGKIHIPNNTSLHFQTAPGDGFAIVGHVNLRGNNIIIRGMRLFGANTSAGTARGIELGGGYKNLMVDHTSVAWIRNESISSWSNRAVSDTITVQDTVIYEALAKSANFFIDHCTYLGPKAHYAWEGHNFQLTGSSNVTLFRNALINGVGRSPKIGGPFKKAEVVNMVAMLSSKDARGKFSPMSSGIKKSARFDVNLIGNYYKQNGLFSFVEKSKEKFISGSRVYSKDNVTSGGLFSYKMEETKSKISFAKSPAFKSMIPDSEILSAKNAEKVVMQFVGPFPRDRYLDKAIADYKSNKRHFQCPNDLPTLNFNSGSYPLDSDKDGMPDDFEERNGLNKSSASDARKVASNGRMWIENYANAIFPTVSLKSNKNMKR